MAELTGRPTQPVPRESRVTSHNYDDLMSELMSDLDPSRRSVAPAPAAKAAPAKAEPAKVHHLPPSKSNSTEADDLMDELMADLSGPSRAEPAKAQPAKAQPANAKAESADDLMDELMADLSSSARVSNVKLPNTDEDDLLNELMADISRSSRPAKVEPAKSEPVKATPAKVEPAKAEPAKPAAAKSKAKDADTDRLMEELLGEVENDVSSVYEAKPKAQAQAKAHKAEPKPQRTAADDIDDVLMNDRAPTSAMDLEALMNNTDKNRSANKSSQASADSDDLLDSMLSSMQSKPAQAKPQAKPRTQTHADANEDLLEAMLRDVQPAAAGGGNDDLLDSMIDSFRVPDDSVMEEADRVLAATRQHDLDQRLAKSEAERKRDQEEFERRRKAEAQRAAAAESALQEQKKRQELQQLEAARFKEAQLRRQEEERLARERELASVANPDDLNSGDLLGHGTWGSTFRGKWKDTECTLKRVMCNRTGEGWVKDFREQCKKLADLNHVNLAKVLAGSFNGEEYVVVGEYIRGADLGTFLRNIPHTRDLHAPLLQISREIAHGLEYLHHNGVTHRDLKSKNVFLVGRERSVKVGDYGFVEFKDNLHSAGSVGSPEYQAPELYDSSGRGRQFNYDTRVDVFAFGVLLWEIFTQHVPWEEISNPNDIPVEVANKGKRLPLNDEIPIPVKELIVQCWDAQQEKRPSFAQITKILDQPIEQVLRYAQLDRQSVAKKSTAAPVATLDEASLKKMNLILDSIKTLLQFPDSFNRLKGLKGLFDVATRDPKEEYLALCVAAKFAPLIAPLINLNDVETCVQALRSTYPLTESTEFCSDFARAKGLIQLVPCLAHQDVRVSLIAIKCLTNLGKTDAISDVLSSCGGLPPLLAGLRTKNQFLVSESAHALSIVLRTRANQDEFITLGGLPLLLVLQNDDNPGTQIRVLEAIRQLISNPIAQRDILSTNVLRKYANLLSSKAPLLQKLAINAIHSFLEETEVMRKLSESENLVPGLVFSLTAKTEGLRTKALRCIVKCLTYESPARDFVEHRGIAFALALLRSSSEETQILALLALSGALQFESHARGQLLSGGGVLLLAEALRSPKLAKVKPALVVISILSHQREAQAALGAAGAGGTLIGLAEASNDPQTRARAMNSLAFITEAQETKAALANDARLFALLEDVLSDPNLGPSYYDSALRISSNVAFIGISLLLVLAYTRFR
jgi:serine/threonine protein kinase